MAKTALNVTLISRLDIALGTVEDIIKRKVYSMGLVTHEKLLTDVLTGPRTGRWYRVPGTNRMYQASAPGEAPATRTGALRQSYRVGRVEGTGVDAHVKVGSSMPYAPVLELDKNREHLSTAVKLARPAHEEILRGDWGI